eukprot:14049769-Heterocapsa_arctica.AAC.1
MSLERLSPPLVGGLPPKQAGVNLGFRASPPGGACISLFAPPTIKCLGGGVSPSEADGSGDQA